MHYPVILEPIDETGFEGYYYAHIPSLDLTTHGKGIDGALAAAKELAMAWIVEKRAHGEPVPEASRFLVTHIEVADAALSPYGGCVSGTVMQVLRMDELCVRRGSEGRTSGDLLSGYKFGR